MKPRPTDLDRWFDEWVNERPKGFDGEDLPKMSMEDLIEHQQMMAMEAGWDAEADGSYWEGRQGEPCTMEEFDEETRFLDQYNYEQWLESHLTRPREPARLDS